MSLPKPAVHRLVRCLLCAGVVLALSLTSYAVKPSTWSHNTEADFQKGTAEGLVITNLGDIKLATDLETLGQMPEDIAIIYDLQRIGDTIYIAGGPYGTLLRLQDGEVTQVAELAGEQVFVLDVHDGQLLLGISGEPSRIALYDGDEITTLHELDDVRYIWDIIVHDDALILATGTDGRVLRLADGDVEELLNANQTNILCIGMDGQGRIYAGTDEEGLIYRLTPRDDGSYETFVVYDAPEPEIGAIYVTADGVVYAGTADAEQARPGRMDEAEKEQRGRPDIQPAEVEHEGEAPGEMPDLPPDPAPLDEPAPADEPAAAEPAEQPEQAPADQQDADAPVQDDAADAPADEPAAEPVPEVTPEQRDRLREQIRGQLQDARRTGQMQVGPAPPPRARQQQAQRQPQAQPARPPQQPRGQQRPGNAIYRIDTDGFVREIFRESVMILRIRENAQGQLVIATGNEGQVYRIDPRAEEKTVLASLEGRQVLAMLLQDDGNVLLGASNPAAIIRLGSDVKTRGNYTSEILDATQISMWGTLNLFSEIPAGTSLSIETRSGNVRDPEHAPWSDWTQAQGFVHDDTLPTLQPRQMKVKSPPARFLQYRITLSGGDGTTPVVDRVDLTYVMPNLPPVIQSLKAAYAQPGRGQQAQAGELAPPATAMRIEWQASDPNEDQLLYKLEYQPAGSDVWLLLAKDLNQTNHDWQTHQVPDGRYLLRVTASDHLDNPPDMARTTTRRSDPVLIDNTPPTITKTALKRENGHLTVEFEVEDALSNIESVHYRLNSDQQWQPLLPDDLIFDSTRESFAITISDLARGPHVLTLRAVDARGNIRYHAVMIQ